MHRQKNGLPKQPVGGALIVFALVLFLLSSTTLVLHATFQVANSPTATFTVEGKTPDSNGDYAFTAHEDVLINAMVTSPSPVTNVKSKMDNGAWTSCDLMNLAGQTVAGCGLYRAFASDWFGTDASGLGFGPNWPHTLYLKYDVLAQPSQSFTFTFQLALSGPASPPSVTWVYPTPGGTVSGSVTIKIAFPALSFTPSKVEFIDIWPDKSQHSLTSVTVLNNYPSWAPSGERFGATVTWDTTKVPDGTHEVQCYVYSPNNDKFGPYSLYGGVEGGSESFWRSPFDTVERMALFVSSLVMGLAGAFLVFSPAKMLRGRPTG